MKKYYLDPNTLLGGIILSNDKEEVVHLSLKKGNEVPKYIKDASILIFIIEGKVELNIENNKTILSKNELVKIDNNKEHSMIMLEDSQILIVKVL